MKNKIILLTIVSALLFTPYILTANEGLANKKYAGLFFTNTKQESEEVGLNELSLNGQYPINTNMSLTGRAALQWKSSIVANQESIYDGLLFELGMHYNFLPNTSVNPFIGGTVSITSSTTEILSTKETDSQFQWGLNAGVEFAPEGSLVYTPKIIYSHNDDFSTLFIGTDIGLWCSPTFIPKISAMYDLDKKIQQYGLSANFLI